MRRAIGHKSRAPNAPADGGPCIPRLLILSLLPLVVLVFLRAFEVPLGQPFFLIYRYSPVWILRLEAALLAFGVAGTALWCLARATRTAAAPRRLPYALAVLLFAVLVVWTFYAPPNYATQRLFDLQSPSHAGAFVIEARGVSGVREYVAEGFYDRLQRSPQQMRGRRVLSNPAGMTVVFRLARELVGSWPLLQRILVDHFDLAEIDDPIQRREFSSALLVGLLLTMVWGASMFPAYALCRLWMSPLPAVAVALACVLNPSTVNFTPGKDTAQLLFVMLLLYCGLASYTRDQPLAALIGGLVAVGSLMVGLVHVWVILIVGGATMWDAIRRRGVRTWLARTAAPFGAGLLGALGLAYLAFDWNVARMTLAVGWRYREIQVPIICDPFYWTLVGFPLFLLFVGPMLFVMVGGVRRDVRDGVAHLGGKLLACTLCVLVFTYFFGNNNETPRLWIPFVPLLLLPMALRRSTFRTGGRSTRTVLLLLIACQVGVSLLSWTVMDVRETEYRLSTGRMWD